MQPYGNAETIDNGDGTFTINCLHGPEECTSNQYEACIINRAGYNESIYFPVIACMELHDPPHSATEECLTDFFNFADIEECGLVRPRGCTF